MKDSRQVDEPGAIDLTDGLFAQTDAENRLHGRIFPNDIKQEARLSRHTRTGRKDQAVEAAQVGKRKSVVAPYRDAGTEGLERLDEIIGERVVIVNNNDLHNDSFDLHFFGHDYGFFQGAEFVVHFLQFIILAAQSRNAATRLKP